MVHPPSLEKLLRSKFDQCDFFGAPTEDQLTSATRAPLPIASKMVVSTEANSAVVTGDPSESCSFTRLGPVENPVKTFPPEDQAAEGA